VSADSGAAPEPELGAEEVFVVRPELVFSDPDEGWFSLRAPLLEAFSPWMPLFEANSPPSSIDSAARDSEATLPAPSSLVGAFWPRST
jgi:hypothetical protein